MPLARHARWLQETLYLLWRQGVDTILWYLVRDTTAIETRATNQSGTFFIDGAPKPAAQAFRLPLVAERAGRRSLRVWGRAPAAGLVRIERRAGAGWLLVRTVRVRRHGTFLVRITAPRQTELRARVASETSLVWQVA